MAKLKKGQGNFQLTPNSKIVRVNDKIGAKGIGKQQGTTRVIYDSIEIVSGATTTYNFFENVNSKRFPFTNLTQNKLQVGETIALQRFSMFIVVYDFTVPTAPVASIIYPLDAPQLGVQGIYKSEMSFQISQDTVIKKLPLTSMFAPFNKSAQFSGQVDINVFGVNIGLSRPHDVYEFDNPIVIPPDIEFIAPVQIPNIFTGGLPAAPFKAFLTLSIEGLGSLFSPKSTY